MPSTVNGIGTRYGGRKNATQYPGTCQSCHRQVTLSAYDTKLWFCVFFIPVIPLKRLRIIHHCPVCTRHYAQPLAKWEAERQLRVSGAAEDFRKTPTPEAAMALHDQLVSFQQREEAATFRDMASAQFADNARLHEHFGATLLDIGMGKESEPYFARAFELRPDLPNARASRARVMIREGRLDEARGLLDFMEKPGAAQLYNLGALEELSEAMIVNRRHAEVLEISRHILTEIPAAKDFPRFRERVKASEKALGKKESMLSKQKFSLKRLFSRAPGQRAGWRDLVRIGAVIGIIVAAVFGIIFIRHAWDSHHRTLHILNASDKAATVEIVGVSTVKVGPHSVAAVAISEGDYRARIHGPVEEEMAVPVRSAATFPWSENPAWVLNVGGFGAVSLVTAYYAKGGGSPTQYDPYFGEKMWTFNDAEYAFKDLPRSLTVKSSEGGKTLRGLEILEGDPAQLISYFAGKGRHADALAAARWVLRAQPENEVGLVALQVIPQNDAQRAEARTFLRAGLDVRPVLIAWHRAYQNFRSASGGEAELARTYGAMLAKAPGDSALLYLLGRVTPEGAEQKALFTKALAADEKNAFPHYALGYDAMTEGDFEKARGFLDRACELRPGDHQMAETRHTVRLGQRDYAAIERESRAEMQKKILVAPAFAKLVEVLALQDRADDARKVIRDFDARARKADPESAVANVARLNAILDYCRGDLAAIEGRLRGQPAAPGRRAPAALPPQKAAELFAVLAEEGKVGEAIALPGAGTSIANGPVELLAASLALQLAGDTGKADEWSARAAKDLAGRNAAFRKGAELLAAKVAPDRAAVTALHIEPKVKAVLLAVLARKFPSEAAWLNGMAGKFNCAPEFPFHLVRRATKS